MFEKEAEEYAENRDVCYLLDSISEDLQNYDYGAVAKYDIDPLTAECFKDGAEFGYNKCKEEINQKGLALQSDMDETIEQNIALKAQIEKMTDTETMLKILKDRGVIRSWYYNGTYHV